MTTEAKVNRIAFLQREIAQHTNPPKHINAGWAARCLADATAELAKLTYRYNPATATAADLDDNARLRAGLANYR
jgi:hypothetical protein